MAICLFSGEVVEAPLLRLTVEPIEANGLSATCQIIVDEIVTVPRESISHQIGVGVA